MNNLNLARKWRPERFDDMVGQDIAVRMIKNSLYRGYYFPVYLFSGQRGCGKTTAARIFAAAINCVKIDLFKKNPMEIVPCTECVSCLAMRKGEHPDFVEVDAASHTGVDNVRQLIESAAFLPVMGSKKVYLIDEVHMLSKAACNALLKILEEPPSTALFILATTDPQKMLETIRSRCFHLFFMAIPGPILGDYLEKVCQQEDIRYERSGIDAIVKESDRCVRDAINLLEQARFAGSIVNQELIISLLGHVSDQKLLELLRFLIKKDTQSLMGIVPLISGSTASIEYVWKRLIELLRGIIWLKNGVEPSHISVPSELLSLAQDLLLEEVHACLAFLHEQYDAHAKVMLNAMWLEVVFLQWCASSKNESPLKGSGGFSASEKKTDFSLNKQEVKKLHGVKEVQKKEIEMQQEAPKNLVEKKINTLSDKWHICMQKISTLDHRLVVSLLSQVRMDFFDEQSNELRLVFDKEKSFFKDLLDQTAHEWHPIVMSVYGSHIKLMCLFEHTVSTKDKNHDLVAQAEQKHGNEKNIKKESISSDASLKKEVMGQGYSSVKKRESVYHTQKGDVVDISDRSQWPVASMIIDYFPGTVAILKEDDHGIS